MTRCRRFDEVWLRWGETGRQEWAQHAARCAECAAQGKAMERLEEALTGLGDEEIEAPPYLATRVMARVAESPRSGARRFGWLGWRVPALVGFGVAAFFAGVSVGGFGVWPGGVPASRVQAVVLEFWAPEAQDVRLVGDFNGWGGARQAVRAERRDGRWVFRVDLEPGRYQYAFLVDGKSWLPDPGAPSIIPDGFGGENSVLYVHREEESSARAL